eukprot:4831971-Pyramimonas_sp.AAC.1
MPASHAQRARLSPYARRTEHRRFMKEAARCVRNRLFRRADHDNDTTLILHRRMARAAWRDDIPLTSKLCASSELAGQHVHATSST